ncbi:MAG: NosD domain-containing protein [Dokdonella sp.]
MFRLQAAFPPLLLGCLVLASLVLLPHASADEVCVSDSVTLQAQLAFLEALPQPRTIKLVRSVSAYVLGGMNNVSSAQTLSIEGGYSAGCASRIVDPANTLIDLAGSGMAFATGTGPGAGLLFDGITLRNGGVQLQPQHYDPGADLIITRTRFTNLSSFEIDAGQGVVRIENSLIDHLAAQPNSSCAATLLATRNAHIVLTQNTIDLGAGDNLCLETSTNDGALFDVYNNIIWASDGSQGSLLMTLYSPDTPPATVNLRYNLFHGISGPGFISNVGQINANPKWLSPGASNYRLTTDASPSPAINQGFLVVPYGLPSTDIVGAQRVQAAFPDLGAYESTPPVPTQIVVLNNNDSGPDSLRAAILAANSNPDANDISFNIPGACPHTIALTSPLPDVTTSMTIYGSSQAGWVANTSTTGFNETLCVLLKPASGTLGYALRIPSSATTANLFLSSLGFGGFGQPVVLLGGKNTVILGNQFGGTAGGVTLPGAGLYGISVAGISAGGSLLIGGSDPAARNMFGGAQQAGINIQSAVQTDPQHCQIAGNLIGMNRDGSTPLPNFTGILLSGSGCFVDSNRIVGNSKDAITMSGLGGNSVVGNVIGVGATGFSAFNTGAGIRITAGDDNAITSNIIRNMFDGGVLVTGSAGDGNAILGNAIYDNGLSGEGMDIDIGALGPTANDPADIDNGPNQLQNFPLVTAVQLAVPTALEMSGPALSQGSSTNVSAVIKGTLNGIPDPVHYLVQAYFSTSCGSNGRGHAQTFLVGSSFPISQVNVDTAFSLNVVLPDLAAGHVVSLTATSPQGSTSEVGTCFDLANVTPDSIFTDGFESLAP